jgi:hypothetical protein
VGVTGDNKRVGLLLGDHSPHEAEDAERVAVLGILSARISASRSGGSSSTASAVDLSATQPWCSNTASAC